MVCTRNRLTAEVNTHCLVIQADPTLNDAKMKLAGIYEATGEVHRAYDLVCQGEVGAVFSSGAHQENTSLTPS